MHNTLLTKLLGQFIELRNTQFFQGTTQFDWRLYCSLFSKSVLKKLGVNLNPKRIYVEEEHRLKKDTECLNLDVCKIYMAM